MMGFVGPQRGMCSNGKQMETSHIRSNVSKTKKKRRLSQLIYNNICKRPPMTETPARASLMPYEAAAALLVVLDPLPVLVDDPTPDLASAVVLQV